MKKKLTIAISMTRCRRQINLLLYEFATTEFIYSPAAHRSSAAFASGPDYATKKPFRFICFNYIFLTIIPNTKIDISTHDDRGGQQSVAIPGTAKRFKYGMISS